MLSASNAYIVAVSCRAQVILAPLLYINDSDGALPSTSLLPPPQWVNTRMPNEAQVNDADLMKGDILVEFNLWKNAKLEPACQERKSHWSFFIISMPQKWLLA